MEIRREDNRKMKKIKACTKGYIKKRMKAMGTVRFNLIRNTCLRLGRNHVRFIGMKGSKTCFIRM